MCYTLEEVLHWTDEQCEQKEKLGLHFQLADVRDLYKEYKLFKDILKHGKLKGYIIKCPNCGIEYTIEINELIRNSQTYCFNCGYYYKQNEHIDKVILF